MNLEQWSAEKEATPAELRRWGVDAEALLKILDGQRIQRFATVSALRSAEANVRAQMDEDVRRLREALEDADRVFHAAIDEMAAQSQETADHWRSIYETRCKAFEASVEEGVVQGDSAWERFQEPVCYAVGTGYALRAMR